jgi:hypothetical protein
MPGPPPPRSRIRVIGVAVLILLVLHALAVAGGFFLRDTVLSTWQKGPLVDPAAPYAPENALLLFPIAACMALDGYLLVMTLGAKVWGRRWWVPVVALVAGCGASEGALRAWSELRMPTWFRPDPVLHWRVREDLSNYHHGTGNTPVTTNADGFREVDVPRRKAPDEYRIMVLGDSSNFGQGVTGSEVWSSQLEALLAPAFRASGKGRVTVLNVACPGWTTYQGVALMEGVAASYDPDLLLVGFNNDPGPEVMSDRDRAGKRSALAGVQRVLFRSESYLMAREATLATLRRMSPSAQDRYAQRNAGEKPTYGSLDEQRQAALVRRVPLDQHLENIETLKAMGAEHGWDIAWLNMPVNRLQPDYVSRYVDWEYRAETFDWGQAHDVPIIDIDGRWVRTREPDLHIVGHVFHPNATGHRRLAEQVASELLERDLLPGVEGDVDIHGPTPAATEETLRLGISSRTPVHAHVAATLASHPELAEDLGLVVDVRTYDRGGPQGQDVANGTLDAFFSCELPAAHMLQSRSDVRVIGTPGVLGRIAVVGAAGTTLADLKGQRVGLAAGSTPAMDWDTWGRDLGAQVVELQSDDLSRALRAGEVVAIVGWDPWVAAWLGASDGEWSVIAERDFHSVLAVGMHWALAGATGRQPDAVNVIPRAQRLRSLVVQALEVAAQDRDAVDAQVAEMSGWTPPIVRAVADRNALLMGEEGTGALDPVVHDGLVRAGRYVRVPDPERWFSAPLVRGEVPRDAYGGEAPGGPGAGRPGGGPPGKGEGGKHAPGAPTDGHRPK